MTASVNFSLTSSFSLTSASLRRAKELLTVLLPAGREGWREGGREGGRELETIVGVAVQVGARDLLQTQHFSHGWVGQR